MADYQAQIRLGVQGLGQIDQLNARLERATELFGNLENATVVAGQIGASASRNVNRAVQRRIDAQMRLNRANRTVENVAMRRDPETGRFMRGPNATARRLASARLRLAQRELREADRNLTEELQNRDVVRAAQGRYARALNRTANAIGGTQGRIGDAQARVDLAMRGIGRESRVNYLTNFFQGRQREFARGGAGARLSQELQQQARNARAAFDLASAGGRENLQLMERLATEMAGLVRQQNELNRLGAGRSVAFEAGRRGQERITDLSRMPGADPARIRRLRSLATNAIAVGFGGDIAGSRELTRRMNASISRYERELDAAATELAQQRRAGTRGLNVQQSWRQALSGMAEIQATGASAAFGRNLNRRQSWQQALAGMAEIQVAGQGRAGAARMNRRQSWQQALAGMAEIQAGGQARTAGRSLNLRQSWQSALSELSETADLIRSRQAAVRQSWRIVAEEAQQRAEQNRRALPDARILAERIAGTAGGVAPTRLDELQKEEARRQAQEQRRLESNRKRWNYNKKLQAEEERQARLGINVVEPMRVGGPTRRVAAIPLGGGADLGTVSRALPSAKMLAARVAGSGMAQPTRLDEQKAAEEKRLAKEAKDAAGSVGRFAAALEREEKRLKALGIGQPLRAGGAIPMGGTGPSPFRSQGEIRSNFRSVGVQESWRRLFEDAAPEVRERQRADAERRRRQEERRQQQEQRERDRQARQARQREQPGFFRGDARKALGEGLIGGAFPLLFGQGLGASIGGFAGGAAGGLIGGSFGFGLSLIGTALGQVVDTTVGKLGTLGGALSSASDTMAAMEEAGFKLRDSQKIQISQLEKVGRGYEAQKQVLKELESKLGPGAVAQTEKLNAAQKELSDSWAKLSLQLGTTFIPVVIAAANAISDLFGGFPQNNKPGGTPGTNKPRKPSDVIADIDALIEANERNKAANREYASLVREVEDWRRDNEEKIFAMRRQGIDIEKQKSDLRLEVENKIFDMRQQTAKLEIDTARSRAQLAIESFDLELAQRADAIGGNRGDFVDQVREYLRARDQGESELQIREKTVKLQIAASERELQQYVLQVADKVAAISRAVEDYKRDQEKFRFESGKRLEDYRIKTEDYIYSRVKERYEYAIGSEEEILRLKMEAASALGSQLPPDAARVLGGGTTAIGTSGMASPIGRQRSGLPPNWNEGLGAGRGHQGQDIGVDIGTTIHAIEDAVVHGVIKGFGDVGDAVVLRYANSDKLGVYGHINPSVKAGQRVTAGQQIGVVTADMLANGKNNTHLHYELWRRSRGAGGQLLDPTERLRAAMSGKSARPTGPATASQKRSGPAMLVPPVSGPRVQPSVPATTDTMFDQRQSSARPGIGDQFISMLGKENQFQDIAQGGPWQGRPGQFAKKHVLQNALDAINKAGASPFGFAQSKPNDLRLVKQFYSRNPQAANQYDLATNLFLRYIAEIGAKDLQIGQDQGREIFEAIKKTKKLSPEDLAKATGRMNPARANSFRRNVSQGMVPVYSLLGQTSNSLGSFWANPQQDGSYIVDETYNFSYAPPAKGGYAPMHQYRKSLPFPFGGISPSDIGRGIVTGGAGAPFKYRLRIYPDGRVEVLPSPGGGVKGQKGAMLPGGGFNTASLSKLSQSYGEFAGPVQIPVTPFAGKLPSYQPAPMATPAPPVAPELPPAPAPIVMPDTTALTKELAKQKEELLVGVELLKKLQELESGRLLLQLTSTREVRNRLEDAAEELFIETSLLGIDKSRSQEEQDRSAEKVRAEAAIARLNANEEYGLELANELLKAGKLQQQEYDQITQKLRNRIGYERDLLQIAEDRAEVARQEAFAQRYGDLVRDTRLTGAGLRAGLVGVGARAFEQEMQLSGNIGQATQMANQAKALEDQQLIWQRLEQNIVDVSEAISGGLTNGLLDIISGSREIEDVGREMLSRIAGTFAESAQQQLSTIMQRQLGGLLGGAQGPLVKMLGGGAEAAGSQGLGAASAAAAGSVWGLSGAAVAAGAALQAIAGQAAFSGSLAGFGGLGSFGGIAGSAFSGGGSGNILDTFLNPPNVFGGFMASGGVTSPNKGYVVGENEPEFFFPGVTGRVVPASDMQKAAALQQANASNEPIDVRYTVTEQRGERYVTEQQFREGMAATSKRAQAMTYAGMRNNKNIRDYVAI